jgi:hypothetical protein
MDEAIEAKWLSKGHKHKKDRTDIEQRNHLNTFCSISLFHYQIQKTIPIANMTLQRSAHCQSDLDFVSHQKKHSFQI